LAQGGFFGGDPHEWLPRNGLILKSFVGFSTLDEVMARQDEPLRLASRLG
jgi:hypothetical protein